MIISWFREYFEWEIDKNPWTMEYLKWQYAEFLLAFGETEARFKITLLPLFDLFCNCFADRKIRFIEGDSLCVEDHCFRSLSYWAIVNNFIFWQSQKEWLGMKMGFSDWHPERHISEADMLLADGRMIILLTFMDFWTFFNLEIDQSQLENFLTYKRREVLHSVKLRLPL